jgi:tetratricopeptide (TPR) repeat protein
MAASTHEIRSLFKWTYRFLQVARVLWGLIIVILLAAILATGQAHWALSLVMLINLGMALWATAILRGLDVGRMGSWRQAVVLSCLSCASLLVPLALTSLIQLLNAENRSRFIELASSDSLPFPRSSSSYDEFSFTAVSFFICAAVAAVIFHLIGANGGIAGNGGGIAAAVSHPRGFTVDAKLSVPQLYNLGRECNSNGDMVCAEAVFKRITELNPGDQLALANAAMAQTRKGDHKSAIENFNLYFARGGQAVDAMAYFAQSYNALGDKEQALKWYMNALNADGRLVDVAENVTTLLIELGQRDRAAGFLDGFVRKNPTTRSYFKFLRQRLSESREDAPARAI